MLPQLRINAEIERISKMYAYMKGGVDILKGIQNPNKELLYLINWGEYICCCIVTGIHAKKWFVVTSKLKATQEKEMVDALLEDVRQLIKEERKNAQCAIEFVQKDSRLGWEPGMEYMTDAEHIAWKLRHLDYVEEFELSCYQNGADEKWYK